MAQFGRFGRDKAQPSKAGFAGRFADSRLLAEIDRIL
jgi:hypothetical protein